MIEAFYYGAHVLPDTEAGEAWLQDDDNPINQDPAPKPSMVNHKEEDTVNLSNGHLKIPGGLRFAKEASAGRPVAINESSDGQLIFELPRNQPLPEPT